MIFIGINLVLGYFSSRSPIRTIYYMIENSSYIPMSAYKYLATGLLGTGVFSGLLAFVIRTVEPYFETKACLYAKDTQEKVEVSALFKSCDWDEFFSYFLKQLIANIIVGAVIALSLILLAVAFTATMTYSAYGMTMTSTRYVQYHSGLGTGTIVLLLLSLCACFAGAVMHYRYALVPFIGLEQPKLGVMDTLKLSAASMKGFKWNLFVMDLSFIGWYFLVAITGGLVGIYVIPYHALAMTEMYRTIVIHDTEPASGTDAGQPIDAETVEKPEEASSENTDEAPAAEEKKEAAGMNFCPYCGSKLADPNANFCPTCGKKLK